MSRIEHITRSLAYMLRHKPEEFDLELDRFGAADVAEVVQALNERLGEPIEEEDLIEAIESGDRVRYDLKKGRIRALYGHSIEVDPGEACKPPELLYVGLGSRDAERAERHGLRAGRRRFLHLAKSFEEAIETGRHQARTYAVVTIYALDAWEQGINFYDRISLYLSDPIPTEFLEVGEIHNDGHPPVERRGRERSGGRDRSDGRRHSGGPRQRGGGRRSERSERPRREDRDHSDSRRGERGDRDRDRDRGDRGGHRGPQRSDGRRGRRDEGGRRDEDGRSRPEPRREAPRPEPRQEAPRPEKPEVEKKKLQQDGPGFGAGLFAEPEPVPEPEPQVELEPEPPRRAEVEPTPEVPDEPAKEEPSGPSFGDGI